MLILGINLMTLVNADGTATIKTDKTDYSPEETVTIFGSGFLANAEVTVTVTRPDGNVNPPSLAVTSDESGNFETAYLLDGITGTYTVTATDGINTATAIFTDTAYDTTTTLYSISTPLYSGQTNVAFGGTVVSQDASHPIPASGGTVQLQYHTSSDFKPTSGIITVATVALSSGSFSGTFTAPLATGIYYFRAEYQDVGDHGDNWKKSVSATQTITVAAAVSITVTTDPSGLANSIVVDSTTYNSPQTFTWAAGSSHTIAATSTISGGSGIQYVWTSWSDGGGILHTVTTPSTTTTYTANYKTQYKLTVASDHDAPSPGVGDHWYDTGTHIDASVTTPADESAGTRYRCTGYTGTGSVGSASASSFDFDISAPSTLTWNWVTQFYVTFDQNGVGNDFTGAVATIDSVNYALIGIHTLPVSFWWDDTSSHSFAFKTPLVVVANKQYVWDSTSGLSSVRSEASFTVTQSGGITGNYHGIVLTYTGDTSGQYSDPVTVSATLTDGVNGIPGKGITFTIGTQSKTAITDSNGIASTIIILNQPAGTYTVTAKYVGPSIFPTLSDGKGFTIIKENVAITYTGDTLIFTAGQTISTASVNLAAHLVQEADGYPGDLTLAKVTFALFKSSNTGGTPDLTFYADVSASGDASTTESISTDVWTVIVTIKSGNLYWTQNPEGLGILVVSLPGLSATGGGWIPDSTSANGKVNFGFMVMYNKNAAPKGNFVCVFRGTDGYDYIVKSNSWQGGGLSFTGTNKAYFTGKCNVQKIDRATGLPDPTWSSGGFKFAVDITDGDSGSPQNTRTTDTIAITVFYSTNAIFRQIGTSTVQIPLGGGNIVVHSK